MSGPLAYYNDTDKKAVAWLRELISGGHIAPGEVDERDIRDVRPNELARFRQCHFFAGVGVWSYAARRAGWPDSRPLWSASLPCQPWSEAGQGKGVEDERHLWPVFESLRAALRPVVAVGEQVASKDGLAWLDIVQADVEAAGDAFGAIDLCSAGLGAPHIRQRLHWMAYTTGVRQPGFCRCRQGGAAKYCEACSLADASRGGCREFGDALVAGRSRHADSCLVTGGMANPESGRSGAGLCDRGSAEQRRLVAPDDRSAGRMGDAIEQGREGLQDRRCDVRGSGWQAPQRTGCQPIGSVAGRGLDDSDSRPVSVALRGSQGRDGQRSNRAHASFGHNSGPGPTNGFWRDPDWLACRDGKWRPVESGTFPLAHGAPARVGRLRGYGNAINAEVATAFIEAVMDILDDRSIAA